jgi:hypothetical protein
MLISIGVVQHTQSYIDINTYTKVQKRLNLDYKLLMTLTTKMKYHLTEEDIYVRWMQRGES